MKNGIYYISAYNSTTYTFKRTNDFDSIYHVSNNPNGDDIRPGDFAYISDGIHESNKNHAFVMTNEHVGEQITWSYSSNSSDYTDHANPFSIVFVGFTGAEALHVDNETIELSSSDDIFK